MSEIEKNEIEKLLQENMEEYESASRQALKYLEENRAELEARYEYAGYLVGGYRSWLGDSQKNAGIRAENIWKKIYLYLLLPGRRETPSWRMCECKAGYACILGSPGMLRIHYQQRQDAGFFCKEKRTDLFSYHVWCLRTGQHRYSGMDFRYGA